MARIQGTVLSLFMTTALLSACIGLTGCEDPSMIRLSSMGGDSGLSVPASNPSAGTTRSGKPDSQSKNGAGKGTCDDEDEETPDDDHGKDPKLCDNPNEMKVNPVQPCYGQG